MPAMTVITVFGVDFTSAPRAGKPIRIAEGQRFVTRVMAERPDPMILPRGSDRT